MKPFILLLSLLGLLMACQQKASEETILRVNSHRQACQGEGIFQCLLVQEGKQVGSENWDLFYGEIEGFHYKPGYVYTLKVRITKVINPPMDGSTRKYTLVKIVSKKPAP